MEAALYLIPSPLIRGNISMKYWIFFSQQTLFVLFTLFRINAFFEYYF